MDYFQFVLTLLGVWSYLDECVITKEKFQSSRIKGITLNHQTIVEKPLFPG